MNLLNIIISAIVGALVLWVAKDFLIPEITMIFSNSVKLHKTWEYTDIENGNVVGRVSIKQRGTYVSVKAIRLISRNGSSEQREFKYSGKISGRNLVLAFEQDNTGGSVSGSIVVRLNSNLDQMVGTTNYFSDSAGKVITKDIFYRAVL